MNQAPAHWSKDFVEHLRTVHFTLIAISAGLILLMLSAREYDVVKALVQIEEILDFRHQWSVPWIAAHGEKTIRLSAIVKKDTIILPIEGQKWAYGGMISPLTPSLPPVVLYFPKQNWIFPDSKWDPEYYPRTLHEFRDWWDGLATARSIEIPAGIKPSVLSEDTRYQIVYEIVGKTDKYDGLGDHKDIDLALLYPHDHFDLGMVDPYYFLIINENGTTFNGIIPIFRFDKFVVSRKTIAPVFANVRPDIFLSSFTNLSSAARDYMDLPLEDVKEFLHDEAAKGQEVFEAFGMKFPAGKVTLWGTILLLSVQLYLFIYLRQLSGRLRAADPGWDVPWVGMDTSRLGQIILFASLIVLPIAAMALLSGQAFLTRGKMPLATPPVGVQLWEHRSEPVALSVALIASTCLGILSWRYRPTVEPEAPSCPPQLFE